MRAASRVALFLARPFFTSLLAGGPGAVYWIIDNREAPMARKPNYKFEKLERERQKAAKKQAKRAAGLHP